MTLYIVILSEAKNLVITMSYKVKLQMFEGPFDLLVYLIESAEMSIYDIQIAEITTQYMNYIHEMEEQDVNIATEFMVLAASLIEIKSKMILPRMTEDGLDSNFEDPRTELVERILEYKRYKELSEKLQIQEERNLHIYEKPQEDISIYLDNPDEYLTLELKEFANAFNLFIQKKQKIEMVRKHYTRVERERANMEGRISLILKSVRAKLGQIINFRDVVPNKKDRYDVIVSFASVLEMAKERVIKVDQKHAYGSIEISAGERAMDDAILEKYQKEEDKEA